jgi:hypothetical protein
MRFSFPEREGASFKWQGYSKSQMIRTQARDAVFSRRRYGDGHGGPRYNGNDRGRTGRG